MTDEEKNYRRNAQQVVENKAKNVNEDLQAMKALVNRNSLIEKPKEQEEKGVAQELAEQLSEMIQGAAEKLAQKVDDKHADKKMTDEEKNYRRNAQQVVENKAKNVNEDLQALKGLVNRNSLLEKPKEQDEKGVAQELAEQLSEMIQ